MITKSWFATLSKLDFETEEPSEGIRLYINGEYTIITGISFKNGILNVANSDDNIIKLTEEPDNMIFSNTLRADWNMWYDMYGEHDVHSHEYKPYAFNSKEALAVALDLVDYDDIEMYYEDDIDSDSDSEE